MKGLLTFLFFRKLISLFLAFLICFSLLEALAIESISYLATVFQPTIDLSAILINLLLRFSLSRYRDPWLHWHPLCSVLMTSFEQFQKNYLLNSNYNLFRLCLNLNMLSIFKFLVYWFFISIPSKCLSNQSIIK